MSYSMKITKLGLNIQEINCFKNSIAKANKTNSKIKFDNQFSDKDASFPK